MRRTEAVSPSGAKRFKLVSAAAAVLTGFGAGSADAAPYLHIDLLGRIQGSGQPFSSAVDVSLGSVVEYAIQIQLGTEGAVNPFPIGAQFRTITNWIPSNGGTTPTAGLNNLQFSLSQENVPGTSQVDFNPGLTATTTGGASWAGGVGPNPGTLTPRGNGNNDLIKVFLTRPAGDFDGIAANPAAPPDELQEKLIIATGTFTVTAVGNPHTSVVDIGLKGFTSLNTNSAIRWRNASNTMNLSYISRTSEQDASVAGGDPIIRYTGLTLPEPGTGITAITLLAAGFLGRRGRRD